MALKIRLARRRKNAPSTGLLLLRHQPRDGRYVERVGHYNPMVPKDHDQRLLVNGERVKF